jgi:hypothetical protein
MGVPIGDIFISYRRSDEPFAALALYFQLARVFSEDRLFMDVRGLHAGADLAAFQSCATEQKPFPWNGWPRAD